MPDKKLREVLKEVDPGLKVIPGGRRSHRQRTTPQNWDLTAGEICKECGREYFRGRDGFCYACWEKANEFEIRDKVGALNFLPQSVIMEIARPARGEE